MLEEVISLTINSISVGINGSPRAVVIQPKVRLIVRAIGKRPCIDAAVIDSEVRRTAFRLVLPNVRVYGDCNADRPRTRRWNAGQDASRR